MFYSNLFLNKKISVKQLLSICFSDQGITYLKRARTLQELKSSITFPNNAFFNGKYILLIKSDLVCTDKKEALLWKSYKEIISLTSNNDQKPITMLLDLSTDKYNGEICLFALDFNISSKTEIKQLEEKAGGNFMKAKESLITLNEKDSQYLSQARGLANFCKTFNYCPQCGTKLVTNAIGTQKQCQKCNCTHYPHVSPVGIVLLEDKSHQKVLLTRQGRHPPGMYSCIAGFIEPGETLKQNIAREVAEEVGLEVEEIHYCLSQHWAMPSSQLMLACIATVSSENFELDGKEILSAQWVTADLLKDAVSRSHSAKIGVDFNEKELWIPPVSTASHQLMVEWLKKYHSAK